MQPCVDTPTSRAAVPGSFWSELSNQAMLEATAPPRKPARSTITGRAAGLLILLYLGLAAAWAWRLHTEPEPGPDPVRTHRLERAVAFLSKAPRETVQPVLGGLAQISDERLAGLEAWLHLAPMQQLRDLTVRDSDFLEESGSLRDSLLLAWLGQDHVDNPAEAHLMIAAAGRRVDDGLKLHALEQLAARAGARGNSEAAAVILERACEFPKAPWTTLRAYTQAMHTHEQPGAALRTVAQWIARRSHEDVAVVEEARGLELNLMLQAGRAEGALDLQMDLLKKAPEGRLPEGTLSRALVCARSTRQCVRVLPWIEKHLATFPENRLPWTGLTGKADMDPGYRRWLQEQAAILDAELPAAKSFDALLRLAATGERHALPRVCALAGGAGRVADCEAFLTCALDQPNLRSSVLEVAQTDATARRVVAAVLRRTPPDHALHFAAALAEAAAAKSPSAATLVWQTYLRRFPNDAPAHRRLIQTYLESRQPSLALRVYDDMSPKALTDEDRRQKAMLRQL